MCTALVSALTKVPVRSDVAMTGEITLRGQVLPIGGLKEKLLAAQRAGVFEAILPKANEKDLPDLPEALKSAMKLHFVDQMDEVLKIALEAPLKPLDEAEAAGISAIPPEIAQSQQPAHQ
ncbi:MAG TPA: S16 family serine protease, partial [Acidobacteriaceae bacterium]